MMRRLATVAPFAFVLALAACGGTSGLPGSPTAPSSPSSPSPAPSPSPSPSPSPAPAPSPTTPGTSSCAVSANVPSTLPASGGQFTFMLTTGSGCAWTAKSDALWADITPGSGQGSHVLTLNLAQHTRTDDSRTMFLTINTQTFRMTQAAATCSYALSTFGLDVRNEGGRVSVRVSAGDGCAWTAGGSSNSWLTVATTSGTGTDYVYLDVAPNTGGPARQGFVTIAGQRVTVVQAAG